MHLTGFTLLKLDSGPKKFTRVPSSVLRWRFVNMVKCTRVTAKGTPQSYLYVGFELFML